MIAAAAEGGYVDAAPWPVAYAVVLGALVGLYVYWRSTR